MCECCHHRKRRGRYRQCGECRTGKHAGGVGCPSPYGATRLPGAQRDALLVGNVVKLAERPVGVLGLHDQVRALEERSLVETDDGADLGPDEIIEAVEGLRLGELREPVVEAVRAAVAMWRRAHA